jgi:hypothetical protein
MLARSRGGRTSAVRLANGVLKGGDLTELITSYDPGKG